MFVNVGTLILSTGEAKYSLLYSITSHTYYLSSYSEQLFQDKSLSDIFEHITITRGNIANCTYDNMILSLDKDTCRIYSCVEGVSE